MPGRDPRPVASRSAGSRVGGTGLDGFASNYTNKIDRKGRVSVPSAWRATLATRGQNSIVVYPSVTVTALEAFGRDTLDLITAKRLDRTLADGNFSAPLAGRGRDDLVDFILGELRDLPFDGEGRIVLPRPMAEQVGIEDEVTFVGRGEAFQLWQPAAYRAQRDAVAARLRAQLAGAAGGGGQ